MKRLAAKTEKKGTVTGTVKKTKVQVSINAGECIWEIAERTDPTCVKNGKLIEKCKLHQDTRETSIPATGKHTYKWVTAKTPTCGAAGSKHQECTVCKAKGRIEKIKATGKHCMGAWKVTKAATAVAAGVKERTCKVCGGAKEWASIAKLKATLT